MLEKRKALVIYKNKTHKDLGFIFFQMLNLSINKNFIKENHFILNNFSIELNKFKVNTTYV